MTSTMQSFFGSKLRGPDGNTVPTDDAIGNAQVIGIYFSAHWCGPCRGFTPILAQTYKKLKKDNKAFEVVFVSSDRDDASFKEYADEMPWFSVPFEERGIKDTLSKKYKVSGIPTLIFVDSQGKTVSTDGRSLISADRDGEQFPWPAPSLYDTLGTKFVGQNGAELTEAALKGKVVALYFSAHWCPPCRAFTPKFAELYKKAQEKNPGQFEVVFVSSDNDEAAFNEYFHEMPWIALPYSEREKKGKLSRMFEVSGIPSVVVLRYDTGEIINANARGALAADAEANHFPWYPPAVASLESPEGINEYASVVVLAGSADPAKQQAIEAEMTAVSKAFKAEGIAAGDDGSKYRFFLGRGESGPEGQIKKLTNTKTRAKSEVVTMLLDIGDSGAFYLAPSGDVTADFLTKLIRDFENKALPRHQLGEPGDEAEGDDEEDFRGFCDNTNAVLRVGHGWYHQPGTTNDLCEAEYEKLGEEEKKAYKKIEKVADLGEEKNRYKAS